MKNLYDNQFKVIDTADKAYILGLFYSDGYVMYKPEKSSYFSGITLIKSDSDLLYSILKKFTFFKIKKWENAIILMCNQKKFIEDLISNGVLPNKSSINKNNLKFPNINSDLYSHFIRGYFDGDGSICFSKTNSVNSKRFSIISNNYFLIKKIKEILYYENVKTKFTYIRGGESIIKGKKVIFKTLNFTINCVNRKGIEILEKYLYKNASLFLKRKHDIFVKWYNFDIKKPKCLRCNSLKTAWLKKDKQIICYNCNKSCTINIDYSKIKIKDDLKVCPKCDSTNVVNNGNGINKKTKKIISYKLKCKDCHKTSQIKYKIAPE